MSCPGLGASASACSRCRSHRAITERAQLHNSLSPGFESMRGRAATPGKEGPPGRSHGSPLATGATTTGAVFAFLACTEPRALCIQARESLQRSYNYYTSKTSSQSNTSTLHTSPSSTPNTQRQTIVDHCGGCPDLRSSLYYLCDR